MAQNGASRGLLLTANLLFTSKIAGAAQAMGYSFETVMRPDAAKERLTFGGFGIVFLDLATPGLSVVEVIAAAPDRSAVRFVAFGPHVETALFESARKAGCDEVIPHSQISMRLPELLQKIPKAPAETGN